MIASFFSKAKTLIERIAARLKLRNVLTFFSHNKEFHLHIGGNHTYFQGNTVNLYPGDLLSADRAELDQAFIESVGNRNISLLTKDAAGLLEDFRAARDVGKDVLDALHGVIDARDMAALRVSFFIRSQSEAKKDIAELKADVIRVYGDRGRKICNLCSSEYFEKLIVPLLQQMRRDPSFQASDFIRRYEIIVEEEAFSVFVHGGMSVASLSRDIVAKLQRNKSYGNYYVNIHALGNSNIKTVRDAVAQVLKNHPEIDKTHDIRDAGSIYVRLQCPQSQQLPHASDAPPPP